MKYYLAVNLEKNGNQYHKIVYAKSPMNALIENNSLSHGTGKESEVI